MSAFGIEEEYLLVDRATLLPAAPTSEQLRALAAIPPSGGQITTEWLACQVEYASAVLRTAAEGFDALIGFREALASTADRLGLSTAALGTAPQLAEVPAAISDGERYREMTALAPAIAAEQLINGMHVHVGVPDQETGVRALNGIRRWLPVLTALSANSPVWRGVDSGFASWRSIHYRRWVVNGTPPHFADAADYDSHIAALRRTDVIGEESMVGWLARLSPRHGTVEIRACDVQLSADDALTLALLIRSLVEVEIEDPVAEAIPTALLDVAHWQAARFGTAETLMDADVQRSVPAAAAVWAAVDRAQPTLTAHGDDERVRTGVRRLLHAGTGAHRQRAALARGGMSGLLAFAGEAMTSREPHS